MKQGVYMRFTFILLLVGFMIAVQYNTVQQPEQRDTRDIWEIRQELSKEKKLHSELLSNIRSEDETIMKYENLQSESPAQALNDTLENLRAQAGLTEVSGPGLVLKIEPSLEGQVFGETVTSISPDLLDRLINEINRFNGHYIDVDGKRIITTTPIRDVNGQTTVNGLNVRTPPFNIRVGTDTLEEAELLYSYLQTSMIADDFFIDNLTLTIEEPISDLTIPAYNQKIKLNYLSEATESD
ncbi:MAG: DUF881 domain-containing protein [Planococcaceae bacterium]|uniref:DUF881 domain-containing protein n=1 Tax=Paenisporosarcina quisquiliarum TaxID=365346 RepID=UPI0024208768|nr:DUF881 domain-containing protein [Bacillota bacterium]MDX1770025.1 DUF881 domain-containing protein [Planococcaceae bacterium]